MMETQPPQSTLTRLRIAYSRKDALRYVGHLDIQTVWERTFRRAGLPIAYTQGFHPQPRLNLACALPLGMTSACELLDVWLNCPPDPLAVAQAITLALPSGLQIDHIEQVDLQLPALQTQILCAEYEALLLDTPASFDLSQAVAALLAAETLPRERRGKPYDLRPLIESLTPLLPDKLGRARLSMRLTAREGATGRPEEVLTELGLDPFLSRVHRSRLLLHT